VFFPFSIPVSLNSKGEYLMKNKYFGLFIVGLCLALLTGTSAAQELLSNPGFETWTGGAGGPPDSWIINGSGLTATQEATTVHGGSYSVNTTWTNTTTVYLEQYVAVSPGYSYKLSAWMYDNDPDGRGRLYIRWYDASNGWISSYGDPDYTEDSAEWQYDETDSVTAPAEAAWAHCELRVYDVSGWDGDATMYWDDASFVQTGTPPPPDTVTIYEVQFNNTTPGTGDDCYPSPLVGETIVIEGIVTALDRDFGDTYYIQDADSLWSGVYCYATNHFPDRGDRVRLTTGLQEYYGMTEMINATVDSISAGNPMPAIRDITPDSLDGGCNAWSEQYEGMLVRIQNVTCTQEADQYGQWYVTDGVATCEIEDGCWHYEPNLGEQFDYIIGVVTYSFSEYEINPRDEFDIPPRPAFAGITHMPTIPNPAQSVSVMASLYESGVTKAILADTLFYKVNSGGLWTAASLDSSSDSYHYYTIPAQSNLDTVFFEIHADNGEAVKSSPTLKYLVLDSPPLLMINEIMYDSPSTDTLCFVELYGAPGLPLTDYELVGINGSDNYSYVIIDLTGYSIPPDGYLVIGQDANVPNVDIINAEIDLQNGPDNLVLRKDGFVYDAVGYGTFGEKEFFKGETWPAYDPNYPYTGSSIGRDPNGTDTDYNRRDFGVYLEGHTTPGTANTAAATYTIQQIQQVITKQDESPHEGERVSVSGIVTGFTPYDGYYIAESPGGPWHGIQVYDLFYEPDRGDNVTVTGTVQEDYGRTQIGYITGYTNSGTGTIPDAYNTTTGNIYDDESLEGVLVEVHSVEVVDTLGYGEFWATDGAVADTCMVDDLFQYSYEVSPGDEYSILRGLVDYSWYQYRIQPRDNDDFILYAPGDLSATLSGGEAKSGSGDVYLQWTSAGADYYVIYRGSDPTVAGDSLAMVTSPTTSYLDEGAVGSTATNYYYVVQARWLGALPTNSKKVGEFDRDLTEVK
jgi:hypothetical protein